MIDFDSVRKQMEEYVVEAESREEHAEVHTPWELIDKMIGQIPESKFQDPEATFLDPCSGIGISDPDERARHIARSQIWMCDDSLAQVEAARELFPDFFEPKIIQRNTLNYDWDMKFDAALGNLPFQENTGSSYAEAKWPDFLPKTFDIVKEDGFVSYIHAGGWRTSIGQFSDENKMLTNRNMKFLSINDFSDGQRVFGAGTDFTWYVLENKKVDETNTTIVFADGTVRQNVDISSLPVIPNTKMDELDKILANDESERVDFIHDWSAYEAVPSRNDHMSHKRSGEYDNPVVYTITQGDGINFKWSSTDQRGHFGVPKVVWSNGAQSYPVVDEKGEYGLTQFAYGLAYDDEEILRNVKKAMESEEFIELMEEVKTMEHKYDRKLIRLLRKDFWKEFVDEE